VERQSGRGAISQAEDDRSQVRGKHIIDLKQLDVQFVTNQSGEKTAVILSLAKFQDLIEDLEDLTAIAERRDEQTISHNFLLNELKQDGLF
jgi:hypothetical protein